VPVDRALLSAGETLIATPVAGFVEFTVRVNALSVGDVELEPPPPQPVSKIARQHAEP